MHGVVLTGAWIPAFRGYWGTAGRVRCAHRMRILVRNLYGFALDAPDGLQSVSAP